MSGSIMPTPLAIPTTRAVPVVAGSVATATFGWVSVVMIPVAAAVAVVPSNGGRSDARCERIRSIG